jgi:hypothetical protein
MAPLPDETSSSETCVEAGLGALQDKEEAWPDGMAGGSFLEGCCERTETFLKRRQRQQLESCVSAVQDGLAGG